MRTDEPIDRDRPQESASDGGTPLDTPDPSVDRSPTGAPNTASTVTDVDATPTTVPAPSADDGATPADADPRANEAAAGAGESANASRDHATTEAGADESATGDAQPTDATATDGQPQPDGPADGQQRPRGRQRGDGPRRVRNGLKFRRKAELEEWQWTAEAWHEALLRGADAELMVKALDYARAGQTAKLDFEAGAIVASVQDKEARPYEVRFEFPVFSDPAWQRILQRTASEAIYAAKLLAGEVPDIVREPFDAAGHPLIPATTEVRRACTCEEPTPCLHIACAALVILERLEIDPGLVFTVRGRTVERFRGDLQEARALATRGVTQAHSVPDVVRMAGTIRTLETSLDDYWRPGPKLDEVLDAPPLDHANHALLKRLGASPLEGRFPITGLLASIYDTVSEDVKRMREDAENRDADGAFRVTDLEDPIEDDVDADPEDEVDGVLGD